MRQATLATKLSTEFESNNDKLIKKNVSTKMIKLL